MGGLTTPAPQVEPGVDVIWSRDARVTSIGKKQAQAAEEWELEPAISGFGPPHRSKYPSVSKRRIHGGLVSQRVALGQRLCRGVAVTIAVNSYSLEQAILQGAQHQMRAHGLGGAGTPTQLCGPQRL